MNQKVILISIDGMRPDGMKSCGNPYVEELEKLCSYTYSASTVFPSVTLSCHYSMAHSVTPQRHGILTNTYVPQVRPVTGIFERINLLGGTTAMFYGWEQLRDIVSPGTLHLSIYRHYNCHDSVDTVLTEDALRMIPEYRPDFAFLYMPDTDNAGHRHGWMGEEYLQCIRLAIDNVKRVIEVFGEEYTIAIMADHGGHDRCHGTQLPEDMTIPLFFYGKEFAPGQQLADASILDIAPTIADLLGIGSDPDWEGHSQIER